MLTSQAYSGYAKMRLEYLQSRNPEAARKMEQEGTLSSHLEQIERAANEARARSEAQLMQETGATEALKASDWGAWYAKASTAQARAREIAIKEVVEAI